MRCFLATLALAGALLAVPVLAHAQQFGDRNVVAWGATSLDVTRAVRCAPPLGCRQHAPNVRKHKRHTTVTSRRARVPAVAAPLPRERPAEAPRANLAEGLVREVGRAFPAPSRFIGGRLICALNVNAALAARGIRGTGSAMAKSFLRWGRSTAPVPGAVAIWNRGRNPRAGHVAIVARVERGRVLFWNPSRRGWRLMAVRRPPIAYRIAG